MARDARKEAFMLTDIDGYICLFTNIRLDRNTIPKDLYCYDVRDNDGDGSFAEIQPFVMVNHWGTIISKEPIPLNQYGCYWPKREEVFLPTSETLDTYTKVSTAKLTEPYLTAEERNQIGKAIDYIPDDLFRIRHKPFMQRNLEEQRQLEDFWCVHVEDIPASVSAFLGMTKEEYQAWTDGLLSLDDGSYHEMQCSHFRLSHAAQKVAQQLLHSGGIDQNCSSVAFRDVQSSAIQTAPPLLSQFFKQLPVDKECMLSSFFDSETPNLVLYDLADELIAVMTENEVLYKEDFAALMKENGMKAAEALWEKVWYQFCKDFPAAGLSLRAQAQASIDKVCACLTQESALDPATLKPSLKKTIQNAEARAGDTKKPTAERDICRDNGTPPVR